MCVFCARVWGMLRADEPESRKPNSGASSSKRRTSRADRLSSGRRGCLDVEPIGDGAKMFQSAVRLETFRKELFPRPPSLRTGGEADEGQPKRHPAREGDFSRRGRKSRKPNSGASSSKRRTSRADRLSSGRRGCLDVEPIGDGAKMFQSAVRLETFRKELFPRPPSPRTGGEADEGQPKRWRAAWRRERTQHARTHNVCMSGIKDFGSNREVAFERWDYEKEP